MAPAALPPARQRRRAHPLLGLARGCRLVERGAAARGNVFQFPLDRPICPCGPARDRLAHGRRSPERSGTSGPRSAASKRGAADKNVYATGGRRMTRPATITAAIITLNERRRLPALLARLDWVSEVV